MRYAALERDDSILTFTGFMSFLFHALLLLFITFPRNERVTPIENIYPTVISYQNFPVPQQFLAFAADRKVFTTSNNGLATPTSGDVYVKPETLNERQNIQLAQVGTASNAPNPIEERVIHGAATALDVPPSAQPRSEQEGSRSTELRQSSYEMPLAPDGIIKDYEPVARDISMSAGERATERGTPSTQRLGAADGSPRGGVRAGAPVPQPGMANIPTASPMTPPSPKGGSLPAHTAYTDPKSVGPTVAADISEIALPTGEPPSPGTGLLGPRRILYQPKPVYPAWAERDNVQARVTFHITVSSDGRVSRVNLAKSSNFRELDMLAEKEVRKWLYEPRPGVVEERTAVVAFVLRGRSEQI